MLFMLFNLFLSVYKGYVNKNTTGVTWVEIPPPLRSADGSLLETAMTTHWLTLVCPGQKVKIRPTASIKESPIGMLRNGDEIEVYTKPITGFYQLANNKVSTGNSSNKSVCIMIIV